MTTAALLIREAERRLRASPAIDHPHRGKERIDAEELLAFTLAGEPGPTADVGAAAERRFRRLLDRREAGEPVAYLTGRVEFHGLELRIRPGAFIPRESSEFLADQAIRRLRGRRRPNHVDLATGLGPVALAVARAVAAARVVGVDIAASPLAQARANARRLGLSNVRFIRGDLFDVLPATLRGQVDVLTIHPPYIDREELPDLPDEIGRFEPPESLSPPDGDAMGLIERTASGATRWLRPGGWLLVEVSPDRARAVSAVLRRAGLVGVRSTRGGVVDVSRVVVCRRRPRPPGR